MILGNITGKCTTTSFNFLVKNPVRKFDFVQVPHREVGFVLCQVLEIESDSEKSTAKCMPLGYKDKENSRIMQLRTPFDIGTEVLTAEDEFIREIIKLEDVSKGAYMGRLDGKAINIFLDLKKLLTKHISVLAKSGSGKSYTVGVLLEEIIDKNIPLVIIDPHGEYSTLKYPNDAEEDKVNMQLFNVEPKNYIHNVQEYGDINVTPNVRPLKLNNNFDADELIHVLPIKLNANQQALLYGSLRNSEDINFDALIMDLQMQDSVSKWNIINVIDHLQKLKLFTSDFTPYNEIVQPGKCSIVNLRGVEPEVQEVMVFKLLKDLFMERKKGSIPPFFLVLEEAHNYAPERNFGETKASRIIRTIAAEGRKFGLGLCIVSQRPARVDKSVLSQCSTQIILKITNPNDVKAISNSIENITHESESEMQNLPIGTALMTGVVDMPLVVNIRPRRTQHGGRTVDMFDSDEDDNAESENRSREKDFIDEVNEFKNSNLLPVIKPMYSKKDLRLMEEDVKDIKTFLIPAVVFECHENNTCYKILAELSNGRIIVDIEKGKSLMIPDIKQLSPMQLSIIQKASTPISAADIMGDGLDFYRAGDLLKDIAKLGFFEFKDGKYVLGNDYTIDFKSHAFLGKIQYDNVKPDEQLQKKVSIEEIREKIMAFADVIDAKECNIVWYDVIK